MCGRRYAIREGALAGQTDVLVLGAACIVPALGLCWKAASLRKEMFDQWVVRVDVVSAGLSECSARTLRELQAATNELLGDPLKEFNPDLVIADPASLQRLTREFDNLLGARRKIKGRFRRMMRLCAVAPYLLVVYLVGACTALTFYTGLHGVRWVGWAGLALAAAAIILGALITVWYWYLISKLTSAEIMAYIPSGSTTEGSADG